MNTLAQQQATRSWLVLMALTFLSVASTNFVVSSSFLIALVVATVVIKGQQIVDIFMGLNVAPKRWRGLLLSYVLIVPAIIGLIFALL